MAAHEIILDTQLIKVRKATEDSGTVVFRTDNLGYDMLTQFNEHIFQLDFGSRTAVTVSVMGLSDEFFDLSPTVSVSDKQIISITNNSTIIGGDHLAAGPFKQVKFTFTGSSSTAAKVFVRSMRGGR